MQVTRRGPCPFVLASRTKGGTHMATNTVGRRIPVWAIALVGVAVGMVVVALVAFGGTAQAQVEGAHDLAINKTPKNAKLKIGRNFTWTVTVTNQRGGTARNVVMVDNLPDFVRFVRASTSLREPGICGPINNRRGVSCSLGNLAVGETVTIKVTGRAFKKGQDRNVASVSARGALGGGLGADLEPSDNRDSTRHRAVEQRGGGEGRCGVKADGGRACVGGVKVGKGHAAVGGIQAGVR